MFFTRAPVCYKTPVGRFLLITFAIASTLQSFGMEPKILKVLPHYLDASGRHSLSPSLYERDAYQAFLRQHPEQRSTLRFDVQWKGPAHEQLILRVEARGIKGNSIERRKLERTIVRKSFFSQWSAVTLGEETYKSFGEMVAWRTTLWRGDTLLSEEKSFLW